MSNLKVLQCDFCQTSVEIGSIDFPQDLYHLIVKYKIPQLIWLCSSCKIKKNKLFSQNIFSVLMDCNCKELEEKYEKCIEKCSELQKNYEKVSDDVKKFQMQLRERNNDTLNRSNYSDFNHSDYVNGKANFSSASDFLHSRSFSSDSNSSVSALKTSPNLISQAPTPSKNKNELAAELKNILKTKIKINPEEIKICKEIVNKFLDSLINQLKQDEIFRKLFERIYYTGSTYEDLRISDASEYDIDFVLKLPSEIRKELKIEYMEVVKSFVKYRYCNGTVTSITVDKNSTLEEKIYKLFFDDAYLIPSKVSNWLQSCIDKVVEKGFILENIKKISFSQNGPARTVQLETYDNYKIDIDIVPVFEFKHPDWPVDSDSNLLDEFHIPKEDKYWFLVPKKYKPEDNENITLLDCKQLWRIHFPAVEKCILHNRGCVKPVIKLLKLLRDKQDWKILASYFLKTVVMWEIRKNPDGKYWSEEHLTDRFLEVLKCLNWRVEQRNIPYLFYSDFNLLGHDLQEKHALNLHYRLSKIISKIEKDSTSINKFV